MGNVRDDAMFRVWNLNLIKVGIIQFLVCKFGVKLPWYY
jgi:hypothetical protein